MLKMNISNITPHPPRAVTVGGDCVHQWPG